MHHILSFYCLSIHLMFSESLEMWVYLTQLLMAVGAQNDMGGQQTFAQKMT